MDLAKIGQFIKDRRKEKNLTQLQLSIELGVSEKTVSKWECGNGFPDTTLMLPLCKVLGITSNELLSGKLLTTESEYKEDAEKNILALKKEHEKTTRFVLRLEIVLGVLFIVVLYAIIFIASLIDASVIWRAVLIILGFVVCITGLHCCMVIEKNAGYYECEHCKHKHIPTMKQMYLSRHYGRTRYLKCPKCNKKSWQRKTVSKD